MKGQTKKVTLLIFWILSTPLFAELGTIAYKATPGKKAFPVALLEERKDVKDEDKFYRTFFGKLDTEIEQSYRDRWWFHEQQVNYVLPQWRGEVIGFATMERTGGSGPSVADVRKDFARHVLRLRIDAGIRAALYEIKNPALIKAHTTFKHTLDTVNNYPLRLSGKPGTKGSEIRVGYDVLSDASKIEYAQGIVEAGIYHPQLFGFATRQVSWDIANFTLSTNFGNTAPKASLSLPLHQNTMEGQVTKELSENVSALVKTGQPLKDANAPHSYYAQIAYRF